MLKWLESIHALVAGIVLLTGSVLWGLSEHWGWEASTGSCLGFIEIAFWVMKRVVPKEPEDRPMIFLELVYDSYRRLSGNLSPKNLIDEEGFTIKPLIYFHTGVVSYFLHIRNNSNINAHNLHIYQDLVDTSIRFYGEQNPLNPLIQLQPLTLSVEHTIELEMTGIEADKMLKNRFPDGITNITFIAKYQDQKLHKTYYTKFVAPNNNDLTLPNIDTSSMSLIKIIRPVPFIPRKVWIVSGSRFVII